MPERTRTELHASLQHPDHVAPRDAFGNRAVAGVAA